MVCVPRSDERTPGRLEFGSLEKTVRMLGIWCSAGTGLDCLRPGLSLKHEAQGKKDTDNNKYSLFVCHSVTFLVTSVRMSLLVRRSSFLTAIFLYSPAASLPKDSICRWLIEVTMLGAPLYIFRGALFPLAMDGRTHSKFYVGDPLTLPQGPEPLRKAHGVLFQSPRHAQLSCSSAAAVVPLTQHGSLTPTMRCYSGGLNFMAFLSLCDT